MPTLQEQMAADNAAMLSTSEFAVDVTVVASGRPIPGILDRSVDNASPGTGQIQVAELQVALLDADVAAEEIVRGALLDIKGITYKARQPVADGTGLTLFPLTEDR